MIYYFQMCSDSPREFDVQTSLWKAGSADRSPFDTSHISAADFSAGGYRRVAKYVDLDGLEPGVYYLGIRITDPDTPATVEKKVWLRIRDSG